MEAEGFFVQAKIKIMNTTSSNEFSAPHITVMKPSFIQHITSRTFSVLLNVNESSSLTFIYILKAFI